MLVPEDLRYAETHEWVKLEGEVATVGITDHAQAELTDIVYVELPAVGTKVSPKQPTAVVESVKAASDVYAPISGEVTETNSTLEGSPGLVNSDPYGNGWLFRIRASNRGELADLKDAAAYKAQIGE
jgi:glycine cleavage system H protein